MHNLTDRALTCYRWLRTCVDYLLNTSKHKEKKTFVDLFFFLFIYLLRAEACWMQGCHFQLIILAENDSFVHVSEGQIE